ncbi:MAG: hypothetical protein WCG59_02960 [Actinomycetes bacterium]
MSNGEGATPGSSDAEAPRRRRGSEQLRRQRQAQIRRRRSVLGLGAVTLVVLVAYLVWPSGGSTSTSPTTSTSVAQGVSKTTSSGPASIEAGVASWTIPSPISRETVVGNGSGLTVLGGLNPNQSSSASTYTIDPTSGTVSPAPSLANAVHDGSGAALGSSTFVFGGGSPNTVNTVQAIATPSIPTKAGGTGGTASGALPQPRSDSAVATMNVESNGHSVRTAFIVGGYTGSSYLHDVLSTTDGKHFTNAASLSTTVRYPGVVAFGGKIYAFGGQTPSSGTSTTATDVIQEIDPSSHTSRVVGHLRQAVIGAAVFVINNTIYVAGGQVPNGITLTTIDAFIPATGKLLNAGLLPQAVAFGGYATVSTSKGSIGYIVGGEVSSQSGPTQAGVASGELTSVISLRPSTYGGNAGTVGAGSPYKGTLLIADRGNNRLITMDASRKLTWEYPSPTMSAPPGGFYFPDDSFFTKKGTAIICNQENNHTIVQIAYPSGKVLWQYGHPKSSGSTAGFLNQPDDAFFLKSSGVAVADASNNRILFISPQGTPTGQIGNGKDAHVPGVSIAYPNGDTPLANGNFLISEIDGSWVSEYTPAGKMVWDVHIPLVNYPSDPQQLGPNLYLMADYNPPGEGRMIEFNRQGQIKWLYAPKSGDAMLKKPSLGEQLPSGLIMINDDYRNRIVVVDPKTNSIVWQYGLTDVAGTAPGMLTIPDGFDNLLANKSTPTHVSTG